jgi:4-hydroxy-3-polyprenylbenzoate decarboxylase
MKASVIQSSQAGGGSAARRVVIGVTGASGQIYASRMIEILKEISAAAHDGALEVDIVFTDTARQVFPHETGQPLPEGLIPNDSYYNRNASGSNAPDALIIIPCTMGTLGRIAAGTSDDLICRIADVQLKERRTLIIVPRETPYSLIHLRNMTTLTEAGAIIAPASPAFYALGAGAAETEDKVANKDNVANDHPGRGQDAINQIVTQFVYRILSIARIYPLPEELQWMK